MKISILNRILLLLTGLLAAWQIAVGIDGAAPLPLIAYTLAFGILLIAGLLLIILGFDVLESPVVVIVSTLIPVSLSLGLVWEYLIQYRAAYLILMVCGFLAIVVTRLLPVKNRLPVLVLAVVHGISGLTIFLLPLLLSITGRTPPGFTLVGVGGALIGIGGLLLSFLRTGKPILSRTAIFHILPALLLLMTAAFVAGFHLA